MAARSPSGNQDVHFADFTTMTMGAIDQTASQAQVTQVLVFTLLDVFDATIDLHQTLRAKAKRDYEHFVRSRENRHGRAAEPIDDDDSTAYESLVKDKAAVKREYQAGLDEAGASFAVGDVFTQTALQSQIITLQSVVITTFLYGPMSRDPISRQMADLVAASRTAGTTAVDVLADQRARQAAARGLPPVPRKAAAAAQSSRLSEPLETEKPSPSKSSATSTALVRTSHTRQEPDTPYPAHTTILDGPSRQSTDISSSSIQSSAAAQCCPYALDLQRYPTQPLSGSITHDPSPHCPECRRPLHLQPGKSWEIVKDDKRGRERQFRVQNRFLVKCHRDSADGGYCCMLCSQDASVDVDTVCGDVRALVKHLWQDHDAAQLAEDEDIQEIANARNRRRDSAMSASSRRSVSMGPDRARSRRPAW